MQLINFAIDLVTLLNVLALAATGLLLRFVLPPGSRGGQGRAVWGLTRHDWGDVHFWVSVGMAALFVVHVALHWSWVCVVAARCLGGGQNADTLGAARRRSLYGVALVLVVGAGLSGFVWAASASAASGAVSSGGERDGGARGYRGGRGAPTALSDDAPASPQGRRGARR